MNELQNFYNNEFGEIRVLESDGLIKVYETDQGEKVVDARELYEGLESKQDFSTWAKKRLSECDAKENQDYVRFHEKMEANNATKIEYILKLSTAKEMAMLERNEKGKEYRKYLITIEEKYKLDVSQLSPELQMFKQIFDTVAATQLKQRQLEESLGKNKQEIQDMRDVISLDTTSWRKETTDLINKMSKKMGGFEHIKTIREESYKLLDVRMGVSLSTRRTNKRRRMADEGVCKSRRDKLNYLDIIAEDKKLIEGYLAIIKEMAIKYRIA